MNASEKPTAANSYADDHECATPELTSDICKVATYEAKQVYPSRGIFLSTPTFIAIFSYIIGLTEISRLAMFYYQTNIMNLGPFEMQLLAAFFFSPEIIKPLIAYLMDRHLFGLFGRKSLVIFSALIKILLFSSMIHFRVTFTWLIIIGTLKRVAHMMDSIICEYSLVMVSKSKPEAERNDSKEVSTYFTFKIFGNIAGMLLGGWIISNYSIQANFYIGILISLFLILVTLLYKESFVAEERPTRSFASEISVVKDVIKREHLLAFFVLVLFFKMVPNIKSSVELYMTKVLLFDAMEFSIMETVVLIAEMLAILCYTRFLRKLNVKIVYVVINGIAMVAGISFLLIVFGYTTGWGLNSKVFCVCVVALSKFCLELNAWPAIDAWYRICPKNAGSTSISLFTGLLVVAHNLGYYLGTILIFLSAVDKQNLDNIWIPIFTQNQYLLFVLFALLTFVKVRPGVSASQADVPMVVVEDID